MPKAKEEQNLKITAFYLIFWFLILCLVAYFFSYFMKSHWPKIIATLNPPTVEEIIMTELPLDDQTLPPAPTAPPASSSAEILGSLLQAILAATPSATATDSATNSATPDN